MHLSKRALLIGGTALAIAAGGTAAGAAIASGPVDSSGVVHGCYSVNALDGSHALVLQDSGTACPKGTTAVTWNQQGPQGPAGPTGPQGPAGSSLSSLESLDGTPCDQGHGTLFVSFGTIPSGPGSFVSGGVGILCTPGVPGDPMNEGEQGAGSSVPYSCGGGGSPAAQPNVPAVSTAGPNGHGAWFIIFSTSASDQFSPPGCVYHGLTLTLTSGNNNLPLGAFMDIYAGKYTGQAPVATGVTTFHAPNGGTFTVNIYPNSPPVPGNADTVTAALYVSNSAAF